MKMTKYGLCMYPFLYHLNVFKPRTGNSIGEKTRLSQVWVFVWMLMLLNVMLK